MFSFGPLAAQKDRDLLSYFHVTRQASGLCDLPSQNPNFIYVARPGGGKSALLSWLRAKQAGQLVFVLDTTQIRLVSSDKDANVGDYEVLIAAELATALISEVDQRQACSRQLRSRCRDYLGKGWWDLVEGFFQRRFQGLSILGIGFTLTPSESRTYLREIRRTRKVDQAKELLGDVLREIPIILVVDDPELIVGTGLNVVTQRNARRLGAFLSVLSDLHSLGVRVILFLKEHILQNVRHYYSDFQHFADQIEGLEWTAPDLMELLQLRLRKRLKRTWKNVFSPSRSRFQSTVLPHLVNGPRDLLRICNSAGKAEGKISEPRIVKSIRALRTEKWQELASHYGHQWPHIDQFATALLSIWAQNFGDTPFSPADARKQFDEQFGQPGSGIHSLRKKVDWVDNLKWEGPSAEERLFLIGCLGYEYEGMRFYPWSGRSLERFQLADSYFISSLFV